MRPEIIALRMAFNTVTATASAFVMVPDDLLGCTTIGFLVGGAATIIAVLAETVTQRRPPTDADFMMIGVCPACHTRYSLELTGEIVTCNSCGQAYTVDGMEVTRL